MYTVYASAVQVNTVLWLFKSFRLGSHHFCLRRVTTRSAYEMIWTHVRDTEIEKSSIPASRRASKSFRIHFRSQRDASKKDVNQPLLLHEYQHQTAYNNTCTGHKTW